MAVEAFLQLKAYSECWNPVCNTEISPYAILKLPQGGYADAMHASESGGAGQLTDGIGRTLAWETPVGCLSHFPEHVTLHSKK